MSVQVIATHHCTHAPGLARELEDLGFEYELLYVEEHPDVVARYGIRHSPNVIVDGVIVCRGPVPEGELRRLIEDVRRGQG